MGLPADPWDAWAYDGVNESILADLTIDGKPAKALVRFDRNGFAYVLDRTSGTLLSAEPYVFVNWATGIDKKTGRPLENPDKRAQRDADIKFICPNSVGGKDQQPSAYSPKPRTSYVPTNNMCMNEEAHEVRYVAGAPYVGTNTLMLPSPGGCKGEHQCKE
jgi:lanthanide-dependent methanol dehydrogenase